MGSEALEQAWRQAMNRLENGQPHEAVEILKKSVAESAAHPQSHYILGIALRKVRKPEDALQSFLAALDLRPDFAEAVFEAAASAILPNSS